VDSALDVIIAPTDPDALKGSGTSVQANAAALTSQYLGALSSLNNSQVKMYDIWLSIFATRMQLYLDLERLPLDLRGVWVEEASPHAPEPGPVGRNVHRGALGLPSSHVVPAGATSPRPSAVLAPPTLPD
jgi:hypothetical protein